MYFNSEIMKNTQKCILKVLFFLLLLGSLNPYIQAQLSTEDVVYLKDGTVYYGKIIDQKVGEYIKLEFIGGSILVVEQEKIEKITRKPTRYRSVRRERNYPVRSLHYHEKGLYKAVSGAFAFSESRWGGPFLDLSLNYRMGYRFSRYLGIGAGVGLDGYQAGMIVPLFADIHGDLFRKYKSPYYHFQFGYGLGATPGWNVTEIEGGMMGYGALGIKIRSKRKVEWAFSVGFKAQENLERQWIGGGREPNIIERDIVYRRILWQTSLFF